MANYYYVRDSAGFTGTATGDGGRVATTPRTGSWNATASESYVSISAALGATTPPASGDYIIVAADHDHEYGASVTLNSTITTGSSLYVVSVSTSNQDQYSAGGQETNDTGAFDIITKSSWRFYGITFIVGDDLIASNNSNVGWSYWENCTVTLNGSANKLTANSSGGANLIFNNCIINSTGGGDAYINTDRGSVTEFWYCDFTGNWDASLVEPSSQTQGGSSIRFIGCDFTDVGSAGTDYLFESIGGSITEESFYIDVERCQINASIGGYFNQDFVNYNSQAKITNTAATSAAAEYQFFYKDFAGETEHSTSSYRDQSVAWPLSGSKTSLVIDTTTQAVAEFGRVHTFELPSRWAELSSATTDAVTFYLSSNTSLTDADVWIDCIYPDGTNKHTSNRVTTRNTDILAAGTALTTDSSSTWTSGGSNKYKIKVDTSGDAGADCVPIMRIYVAVQATIYLDWYPELGT